MTYPLISLENIALRLGGREILRDVSCEIRQGRHVAIVGDNGSGKSSLLRILDGALWPVREQGSRRYSLDGKTQVSSPLLIKKNVRRIAPELQERFLRLGVPVTVFEFVASGLLDQDYAQVELDADEKARVNRMLDRMRLRHVVDREARKLSHGMLRRAFIARALVAEPTILVLDEVTDGLDTVSRQLVLALLDRAVDAGTTLICVAHRVERLPSCVETFFSLKSGRLSQIDAPEPIRYGEFGTAFDEISVPSTQADAIVTLDHVDVAIDETPVLFDICVAIRAGEHIAILGENGVGKSTLAGVIDGTYLASAGSIVRHGFARRPSIWEIRRRIVTLSDALQVRHDWMFSVRDTIASGFSQTIGTADELSNAQALRLANLLDRFALSDLADRDLPTLSFGQRRRVLLARALVSEPEILILDEIFDGLDGTTRAMLEAELAQLAHGATTLICISHVEEEIPRYIKRRIRLAAGRVISEGDPERG